MTKINAPTLSSSAPRPKRRFIREIIIIAVITNIWIYLVNHGCSSPSWTTIYQKPKAQDGSGLGTDWDAITPSEKLTWTPCYGRMPINLLCARLTVPMDYSRPLNASSTNPKVHIALIMLPAKGHSLHDPASKFSVSPLLVNPGGPGGSGVQAMLTIGDKLSTVVGLDHDIVSFDPRGVGFTWPLADCFLDDHDFDDAPNLAERNEALLHRLTYTLQVAEIGLANSSEKSLGQFVTRTKAITQLCAKKDGPDSIFRYIGTPNVARDLLSIVEAWDSWINKRAETRAPQHEGCDNLVAPATPSQDSRLDTRGKLVYWGFSYGTVLGGTFASMFPHRVGRLVLDGVVNLDIYRKSDVSGFITDAEAVFDSFFRYCCEAREKCFFYRPGQEPNDLRQRYVSIMSKLEQEPLIVTSGKVKMPVVVRASDIHTAVFRWLSMPTASFPVLALFLGFIERELDIGGLVIQPDLSPVCSAKFQPVYRPDDSNLAILCSDLRFNWNKSLADIQEAFEKLAKTSTFADYWALVMAGCTGWNISPVDPPGFNINTTLPQEDGPAINTSFPILFVSNTFDPVTPMQNGLAMSRRFVDAGFVEQQIEGHCSISSVSLCTLGKIKAYLDHGVVPPPPKFSGDHGIDKASPTGDWDRCKSDEHPWKPFVGPQGRSTRLNPHHEDDIRMAEAWRQMRDNLRFGSMSTLGHRQISGPLQKLLDMSLGTLEDMFTNLVVLLKEPSRGGERGL